ncbi:MAG: hypothetical protein Ta2D_13220 [Rickettsiales bacterium]|nr:MAG: hypothetical protein Ta2D_13220 [Rickettsiales bacterium]
MDDEKNTRNAVDVAKDLFKIVEEDTKPNSSFVSDLKKEEDDTDDDPQGRDIKSEEKKLRDSLMGQLSDEAKNAIGADNLAMEDIIAKLKTKTIQKEQGVEMLKFRTIGENTKGGRGI